MNIIDAICKEHPHKEIVIDKCVRCGKETYKDFVICKSCIADTLIFNQEFAGTILGTNFFDNFKFEEWEEIIEERLKNRYLTK